MVSVLISLVLSVYLCCSTQIYAEIPIKHPLSAEKITCSCYNKDILTLFCTPIKFTRKGMQCFLQHVFNHKQYGEFLSHNLSHLIQFLHYGKETQQDYVYLESCIRLFNNKLKSSYYVMADSFADFAKEIPDVLKNYFPPEQDVFTQLKETIKKNLFSSFLSKFPMFKQDPNSFFDNVCEDIITAAQPNHEKMVNKEHLRRTLIRFLEQSLGKVIWCPLDQDDVWNSVKKIAHNLEQLVEQNIIDGDDLDDLFQSLVERFCHFLELSGSELMPDTIEKIRQEIITSSVAFLETEEQEEFMRTKKERLLDALTRTEAKIIARNKGIITEVVPYTK